MYAYPNSKPNEVVDAVLYSGAGIHIPTKLVGLHCNSWPNGLSTAPQFNYGTVRVHDYGVGTRLLWSSIHTAAGVYDWSLADEFIDAHVALGHQVYWQIQDTPTWASIRPTEANPAYGRLGGCAPPATIGPNGLYTELYNFVVALLTRYAGKINIISPWNEPSFPGSFWTGTIGEIAKVTRTVREAARSVDPSVLVTCPDWSNASSISAFMTTSDGATGALSPLTGRDICDAWTYHPYNANSFASNASSSIYRNANVLRSLLVAGGVANPVMYMSEFGWTTSALTFWQLSIADQAKFMARSIMHAAAAGVQACMLYSYDNVLCNYIINNSEMQLALGDVHDRFAGQTFTAIEQTSLGRVRCTKLDGTVLYFC